MPDFYWDNDGMIERLIHYSYGESGDACGATSRCPPGQGGERFCLVNDQAYPVFIRILWIITS